MRNRLPQNLFCTMRRLAVSTLLGALALECPLVSPSRSATLTPQEQSLWAEKTLGRGTSHLEVLSRRRAEGEVTTLRVLVILVDFPDQAADRETHTPEYYRELLFSRGTYPSGSVADFLAASSNGRLQFTGDVRGWITLPEKEGIYVGGSGGIGEYPYNSQALAEDAISGVDTTFNYADIDNEGPDGIPDSGDDDEIVDGVVIIHAGPGREGGSPSELISIMWQLPSPLPVDGVFARYFTLNPEDANIGILIHELGHLMGLPDLYDTAPPPSYGLGQWSIMAGGFVAGNGEYPVDFDAFSKVVLGFSDLVNLQTNALNQPIIPTQDGGSVYKLWTDGSADNEYFLVEARRKSGLDSHLPGGGLLIYHIDDNVGSNNNPERYLAALEQADGLYQLEGFYGEFSPGDPGDAFQEGDVFSRYTTPSSDRRNRTHTAVAVSDIRGPETDGSMVADLFVERTAHVGIPVIDVEEASGNGDGILQRGETANIIPHLSIEELPAEGLMMTLSPVDSTGLVVSGQVEYPYLGVTPDFSTQPFTVKLDGPFVLDPQPVEFKLNLVWNRSPGRAFGLEIGVGSQVGNTSNFNTIGAGWKHFLVTPGFSDSWYWDPNDGTGGTGAYRCGRIPSGVNNFVDAALESPLIVLPEYAELVFDHKMDLPNYEYGTTLIGGVIEISVNGSSWSTLVPEGGYTHRFIGPFQNWRNRDVFAGLQDLEDNPGFKQVRVDLSAYAGSAARIRFRLVSGSATTRGDGWIIDNVRVRVDPTPVTVLSTEYRVDGDDLVLSWHTQEVPARTVVRRGPSAEDAVVVGSPGEYSTFGRIKDPGGALRSSPTYWLEFWDREGTRDLWGPWNLELRRALHFTVESPSTGQTLFRWAGPVPEHSRLEIYDVQGRLVWAVPTQGAGLHLWQGQTRTGGTAASGVYFARLSRTSLEAIKFVRVSR